MKKRRLRECHYSMLIQWSPKDDCFIVMLPEFGNVKTYGKRAA